MPASAIMAGAAPDTPAARVDANTETSTWRGVVAVLVGGGIYSGALIGPRHVLTAGHVFDSNPAASAVVVQFNLGATPIQIGAAGYAKHPQYVSFSNPNLMNDLAVIELSSDAPDRALAYQLASAAPATGAVATLVGYGGSGAGDVGISVSRAANVKRTGRNTLDAFGYDSDNTKAVYYFDFDGSTTATNVFGGVTLGNASETTVAGGDSGGPAFVQEAGVWKLAGVNTFTGSSGTGSVASTFGTLGGGQVVAHYADWINGITSASSAGSDDTDVPEFGSVGQGSAVLAMALSVAMSTRRRVGA